MSLSHLLRRQTSAQAIGHAGASGYTAPTAIIAAAARNLQTIKDKHADQKRISLRKYHEAAP